PFEPAGFTTSDSSGNRARGAGPWCDDFFGAGSACAAAGATPTIGDMRGPTTNMPPAPTTPRLTIRAASTDKGLALFGGLACSAAAAASPRFIALSSFVRVVSRVFTDRAARVV